MAEQDDVGIFNYCLFYKETNPVFNLVQVSMGDEYPYPVEL